MCGRVNTWNKESIYEIMRMYTDEVIDNIDSRYNVAPGASLAGLYHDDGNHALAMHWGFIPLWAKPDTFKRPLINARAETVFDKPSFRSLMKKHRCVIAINGFYEWQRREGKKVPYYFLPADDGAMLLGGIFQFNKQGVAECCLVTTAANELMRPVHDRMPVVIAADSVDDWLQSDDRTLLNKLMLPPAESALRCYQVSSHVSRASNDGAKCIEAVS